MKRLFVSFMLIFSLSFLCGFSSKSTSVETEDFIMLSLDFSSNGQIVQSIDFSFNSEAVNEISSSLKETLDFKNALIKNIETIRNEFLFSFALTYMANPVEEYKINKGVLLTAVTFDEENDTVGFKMGFSSLGAWNYYHQSGEKEDSEGEEEKQNKNIFLNKIESKGIFPFSAQVTGQDNQVVTVGSRYKNFYISSAQSLSFYEKLKETYQPTFIYNYSSFNKKLRSDGDLFFTDSAGHLHHVWLVDDLASEEENSINLYYYLVEKGVWLIFAITIPLFAMFIAIIIIKIKDKRKIGT